MSEASKAARKAMHAKIARITRSDPKAKVDASGYVTPDPLDADVATGMRPISRRQFKRGGKVMDKVEGCAPTPNAGRKARKSGGSTYAIDLMNRDQKEANEKRDGKKHIGGFARGGATKDDSTPMRLKKTYTGPDGHVTKVYKNPDYNEHVVRHYSPDGKYLPKADYFDDAEGANDHAKTMADKGLKRGGTPKKAGGGGMFGMSGIAAEKGLVDAGLGGILPMAIKAMSKKKDSTSSSTTAPSSGSPDLTSPSSPGLTIPTKKRGGSARKADGGSTGPSDKSYVPTSRMAFNGATSMAAKAAGLPSGSSSGGGGGESVGAGRQAYKAGGRQKRAGGGELDAARLRSMNNEGRDFGRTAAQLDKAVPPKVPVKTVASGPSPEEIRMAKAAAAQNAAAMASAGRAGAAAARPVPYKKGGEASWEGSKEDLRQDKKLALKHKMSFKDWEKSDMDERHDRQRSMKGLKHGGSCSCAKCSGGRAERKHGGRTGKTNINIIIGARPGGERPPQINGAPPMPPMPPRGVPVPVGPAGPPPGMPMGGPPPGPPPGMMPPMGPPPGAMPMGPPPGMPMPRKSGGRVAHAMAKGTTGAGGGLGRLKKIDLYGEQ